MSKEKGEIVIKALLKSLCCGNGWSYAVFWSFNQQNSLLLTLKDAYYEEEMGGLIDDMLLQVHILGSGVIGQVAFTKKHKWMLSDTNSVWQSCELLQDDSEFYGQFCCGIKTVAVISVEHLGVVQFGSDQKLPERMEFVAETKKLFKATDIESILAENGDIFCSSGSLTSSICNSPYFMGPKTLPSPDFADLLEPNYPITNMVQPFPVDAFFSPFDDQFQNVFCALPNQFEYCSSTIQNVLERPIMTSTHELVQTRAAFGKVFDDFATSISGCTSEHSIGSKDLPSNRLFAKLGLDRLLNDTPSSSCSFVGNSCNNDHFSSTKKRRIENTNLPTKGHERTSKAVKKKAKPGTRPVPKDRARTYQRLAELRELIPNGKKMSIDRLLHQTIKQLIFLQSVTRLTEELKKTEELKDKMGRKDNTNGVTWACEIENQTMICPLIVEDLSTPGQMLIEMLCEEQGFFLEIVDIIRGFGLNILKGTMELRETKIWAHFIVEAEENRFVSRHELFSSLLQLLQLAGPSELHARDQLGNCSESALPFPISLPEGVPCTSLY